MVILPQVPHIALSPQPSMFARNSSFSHHHEPHDESSAGYTLLGSHPIALIVACISLDTLGQAVLILLVATLLLSPHVRQRNNTLINLLVVTLLCSIPPALLFYTDQYLNHHPPHSLCLLQAILKHGTDPMFVVASLALVLEFLQSTEIHIPGLIRQCTRTAVLVAAPYMTFALFATISAVLGGSNPQKVIHKTNQLYCSVDIHAFTRIQEIFIVIVVVVTVSLEGFIIFKLRRTWDGVRRAKKSTLFTISQTLRIAGFTILQLSYIILCAVDNYFNLVGTHVIPIVYEAFIPLGTFLIFGTTADCLYTWFPCWSRFQPLAKDADDSVPPTIRLPKPPSPSEVVNLGIRLSLHMIPGFKTPSDFMSINEDALSSAHRSSRTTHRYTLLSTATRATNAPSVQRSGDGLSTASSGDQPRTANSSPRPPSKVTTASSVGARIDTGTLASSDVRTPATPKLERPYFLTLSLPPPGLSLDLDFDV